MAGVVTFNVAESGLLGQFYRWRKLEGIGFMTLEDVERFLDEACGFFGTETRGEYGMKQCLIVRCSTNGMRQGTLDMWIHVAEESLGMKETRRRRRIAPSSSPLYLFVHAHKEVSGLA